MDDNKNPIPQPARDLSSRLAEVSIPNEDADKPADINLNPNEGDEGVIADPDQKAKEEQEKLDAEKAEAEKQNQEDAKKTTGENNPDPTADDPGGKSNQEDLGKKQELTPFHEHPDWKKSQEEKQELRDTVNRLQGQVDALLKSKETTQEEKKEAIKTAEERLAEDYKNGWRPQSRLEEIERNNKYIREELAAREKAKQDEDNEKKQQLTDTQEEIFKIIGSTMDDLKKEINLSPEDETKVFKQVDEWANKGLIKVNKDNMPEALKMAATQLKAAGLIGVQPKTEKTKEEQEKEAEEQKAAEEKVAAEKKSKEEADAKRKQTLSRINRSNTTTDKSIPEKKPLAKLRRSLDDVVYEHQDM